MTNTEKLRNACESAVTAFTKINNEEFSQIQANLEYCIGSYDNDKNPSGLYEFGNVAVTDLKKLIFQQYFLLLIVTPGVIHSSIHRFYRHRVVTASSYN